MEDKISRIKYKKMSLEMELHIYKYTIHKGILQWVDDSDELTAIKVWI